MNCFRVVSGGEKYISRGLSCFIASLHIDLLIAIQPIDMEWQGQRDAILA